MTFEVFVKDCLQTFRLTDESDGPLWVEVRGPNGWYDIATPPYVFMACVRTTLSVYNFTK
jgi:hypothetical protein